MMLIFLSEFLNWTKFNYLWTFMSIAITDLFNLYIICPQRKAKSNYIALNHIIFSRHGLLTWNTILFNTSARINKGTVSPKLYSLICFLVSLYLYLLEFHPLPWRYISIAPQTHSWLLDLSTWDSISGSTHLK